MPPLQAQPRQTNAIPRHYRILEPVNAQLLTDLLQRRAYYYTDLFKNTAAGVSRFNWRAFFFGPFFLLYRKLYKKAMLWYMAPLIIFMVMLIPSIFLYYRDIYPANNLLRFVFLIFGLYCIALPFYAGFRFNRNYLNHVEELAVKILAHQQNEKAKAIAKQMIEDYGGTSLAMPVAIFGACVIMIFFYLAAAGLMLQNVIP